MTDKLKEIRIVVAAPGTRAVIKTVPNTVETLQAEVGGNLELYRAPSLRTEDVHCYINEDGKRLDLEPNLSIGVGSFIVGNVVASKVDLSGEEIGLTERDAKFACLVLDTLRGLK
jgi:hypothetical protein